VWLTSFPAAAPSTMLMPGRLCSIGTRTALSDLLHADAFYCTAWLLQGIDIEPNVNFEVVAGRLGGYSGDDITNICRCSSCRWKV
jgi:hypothetical protein